MSHLKSSWRQLYRTKDSHGTLVTPNVWLKHCVSVTFFNRKSAKITQPCASHSFSIFFVIRFHFIEKSKYLYETYGVGAFQPIWIMWQAKLKFTENSVLCSVSVHHSLVKRDFIGCYKLYGSIIVRVCISCIRTAQRHS